MSREDEARIYAEAEEAKRRLRQGIDATKALVVRYRAKLTMLGSPARPGGGRLVPAASGEGR